MRAAWRGRSRPPCLPGRDHRDLAQCETFSGHPGVLGWGWRFGRGPRTPTRSQRCRSLVDGEPVAPAIGIPTRRAPGPRGTLCVWGGFSMRVLGYRRASPGRVTGPCWAARGRATGEVLSSRRQPQGAVARHLGLWTRPPGPRALFVLMLGRSRWQATTPRVGWGEPLSEPRGQVTGRTTPRAHRARARKARGRRVRAGCGVAARTAPTGPPPAALSPAVGRPPLHTRSCPRDAPWSPALGTGCGDGGSRNGLHGRGAALMQSRPGRAFCWSLAPAGSTFLNVTRLVFQVIGFRLTNMLRARISQRLTRHAFGVCQCADGSVLRVRIVLG